MQGEAAAVRKKKVIIFLDLSNRFIGNQTFINLLKIYAYYRNIVNELNHNMIDLTLI